MSPSQGGTDNILWFLLGLRSTPIVFSRKKTGKGNIRSVKMVKLGDFNLQPQNPRKLDPATQVYKSQFSHRELGGRSRGSWEAQRTAILVSKSTMTGRPYFKQGRRWEQIPMIVCGPTYTLWHMHTFIKTHNMNTYTVYKHTTHITHMRVRAHTHRAFHRQEP